MGLDTVELVIRWEKAFAIDIPDAIAAGLTTPRQAADAIELLLASAGRPMPRHEIDAIVKETTLEISGVREDRYHPDVRFIQDLGLD